MIDFFSFPADYLFIIYFSEINLKNLVPTIDLSQLPCDQLSGVGQLTATKLTHLGINSVQDLLFHLPFRYQDRTRLWPLSEIRVGEYVVIQATIHTISIPKSGRTRFLCRLEDGTGVIYLRFFHISALQRRELQEGVLLHCIGEVRFGKAGLEMVHPEYHLVTPLLLPPVETHLTPIYHTTEGLSQNKLRKLTEQALGMLTNADLLPELLPHPLQAAFPTLKDALHYVHRPPKEASVDLLLKGQHVAQKRLGFEELLAHRLSLLEIKRGHQQQAAIPLIFDATLNESFIRTLPFTLTNAQQKVAQEIFQDLSQNYPMLRLVQGDVGSGKTIVAALAMLQAIHNGTQAALLAPTELLVEQHFKNFQKWFAPFGIKVGMLSRQMQGTTRMETVASIAKGEIQLIVGTHALFQKEITFAKLVLIVIDEQHRFGVQQRMSFREKGLHQACYPHQLIMTATPIPRTLAMSVYADLDYSVIDELPPGRIPIVTRVMPNTRRHDLLQRLSEACASKRQVYWVCTLITESDVLQCQAAINTAEELKAALPHLNIALLHGRMKALEKEEIMAAFKKGDVHILVATTVIEVGVDVPNASLMVIENAERLGLAQLHQLRGRVGRGCDASHCLLIYQAPLSYFANARLKVMRETTDGFQIAEHDLELRGPGEVLGTKQTGDLNLRIANLMNDQDLLPRVQATADIVLKEQPDLIRPLIKRWLKENERYSQV